MRRAFFGGTFDPPHRGHLTVAVAAADAFQLDQVLLAPVGRQPLKSALPRASYLDRFRMTELLCAHDSRLTPSAADAPRIDGHANYTVDTVARLLPSLDETGEMYVIVGADAFLDFRRWKDPERLLQLARFIVISRPGFPCAFSEALRLSPWEATRVHVLEGMAEPASATKIRERLQVIGDCDEWLLPEVQRYIQEHHLYGTGS